MASKFQIGVAVGSGLAARAAEQGGANFLLAINAGRMRNMGAPSVAGMLPIMDARVVTDSFAETEILSQSSVPVFLGQHVFGRSCDPDALAEQALEAGFAGVVNFPSSMHFPASMQRILERGQRGIQCEVEVLKAARKRGLKTLFYCANRVQARLGADALLDMILLNFGWNTGGAYGHKKRQSIEEVGISAREIGRFVKRIHPGVQFLLEGGPIVTADDLSRVLEAAELDGYVGGSTIERLPAELSIADQIASYRITGDRSRNRRPFDKKRSKWVQSLGYAANSEASSECIDRLESILKLATPLHIRHEPGTDVDWAIRALAQGRSLEHVQAIRPKVEDRLGVAGRRIFGTSREGVVRQGYLGDPSCVLLVIHSPELLSPRTQLRLARALRAGYFFAPGTRRKVAIQPRLVFLSETWAQDEISAGLEDTLASELRDWGLFLPALRYRLEDIEDLMELHYARIGLPKADRPMLQPAAIQYLRSLEWQENDSLLARITDHLSVLRGEINLAAIEHVVRQCQQPKLPVNQTLRSEKARILEALWRNGFHRGKTAAALGISRKTLYNKICKYGLAD